MSLIYPTSSYDPTKASAALLQGIIWEAWLPIAAKGDLRVGISANNTANLTVGSNGYILVADSTQTTGMRWSALADLGYVITAPGSTQTGATLNLTAAAATVAITVVGATGQYSFSATGGNGIFANAITGNSISITATSGSAGTFTGNGAGSGIVAGGGATGSGGTFTGGTGASGNEHGISATGGTTAGYGVYAQSTTNYSALYGLCSGASTGAGVSGTKWNGGGGWGGAFLATAGADGGVRGEAQGPTGIAGYFYQSNAASGTSQAIYAQADGSGPGIEVYGGQSGTNSFGIYAHGRSNCAAIIGIGANTGTNAVGVRGFGGANAVGGSFAGTTARGQLMLEPISATPSAPIDGEVWVENIGSGVMSVCARLNSLNKTLSSSYLAIAYSASITPIAAVSTQSITPNNGTAFTINVPAGAYSGRVVNLQIINSFGTLGALTFATGYKIGAAWTQPANGFSRTISFMFNGTNWYEISRTAADVSN